MNVEKFLRMSKELIVTGHAGCTDDNVVLVWFSKTLDNIKCIYATPTLKPVRMFECTYNGKADELYIDAYQKISNGKVEHASSDTPGAEE